MSSKATPRRRRRVPILCCLILIAVFTVFGLLIVDLRSIDPSGLEKLQTKNKTLEISEGDDAPANMTMNKLGEADPGKKCATVEQMGEIFSRGYLEESLRVRSIIRNHFAVNGTVFRFDFGLPASCFLLVALLIYSRIYITYAERCIQCAIMPFLHCANTTITWLIP